VTFTRLFLPVESLWVYHYKGRGQLRSGIDHPHQLVDNWVAGHGIVHDDRRPLHLVLSRLRKTHKALWYLKTEGHMARFAVGHTPEIAARHYADIPSLRPLHEATVAEALTEVVAAAGPIVLSPDSESLWRQGADVPVQTHSVPALLDGDQDVWLAACSGFQNSPFAEAGSPCPQPFWGCLNAAMQSSLLASCPRSRFLTLSRANGPGFLRPTEHQVRSRACTHHPADSTRLL
jgi:hypothetical protein